jgi:hypothetical protein
MRRLVRWAAKLYPLAWWRRYGPEFEALLEDLSPSWKDVSDVVGRALTLRGRALIESKLPAWSEVCPVSAALHLRLPVVIAMIAHAMVLSLIMVASSAYVAPIPWNGPAAPSPPPPPLPPAEITDSRVFRDVAEVYSSLPFRLSGNGGTLFTSVVEGVGIYFPPLPDIGTTDRRRNPIRRVWPGHALERSITRRVVPQYPAGTRAREVASVVLEYLIGTDGSVKVLRTSGPALFANAARAALESWEYQPMRFEDGVIEVVSRVEVRFDGALANAAQ